MSNTLSQHISELQILSGDSIYVYPHIPLKKATNAIKSYGEPGLTEDQILILVDDTVFGSAKNGMIVTEQTIYIKPKYGKVAKIEMSDIKEIKHRDKRLLINGSEFLELVCPKTSTCDKLYNYLEEEIAFNKDSIVESNKATPGIDNHQDFPEEINLKQLEHNAAKGNTDAQYALAQCYFDQGEITKGFSWFEKAAKNGDSDVKYDLAISYDLNDNEEEAFYWYKKAAEEGNKEAQLDLGLAYMLGKGIQQDEFEGHKWFIEAAENGNIEAMWSLGKSYLDGDGTNQDQRKAFYWFRKGAENGDPMAQNSLGICYLRGRGTEIDKQKAFYWVKKAAEAGEKVAQGNLGDYYRNGTGTSVDMDKAYFWYQKAAEQGDRHSEEAIDKYFSNASVHSHSVSSQDVYEDKEMLSRTDSSLIESSLEGESIKEAVTPAIITQNRLRTNSKFYEPFFKEITRLKGYELLIVAFLRNNAGDRILNLLSKLPYLGIAAMLSKFALNDALQWLTDQFVDYGEQFIMGKISDSWHERKIRYDDLLNNLEKLNIVPSFILDQKIIEDSKMLLDKYYNLERSS